jgi:PPOX class probable F420-dependent enzyme
VERKRCWRLVSDARVAVLATVRGDGSPRTVPVVFAVTDDLRLVTAVDHKPKSTRSLRRLDDIAADPRVTMLFNRYSDDWTKLWWVRIDGIANVVDEPEPIVRDRLVSRYPQYTEHPPDGPWIVITPQTVVGWEPSPNPTGRTSKI